MQKFIFILFSWLMLGSHALLADGLTPPLHTDVVFSSLTTNDMEKMKPCTCPNFPFSGTVLGSSGTLTGVFMGGQYIFNNNITIVGSVTLNSAQLLINSGITINVPSGSSLRIIHSHLFGCSQQWEGIHVQNGGNIYITDNSLIEDGTHAVNMDFPANTTTTTSVMQITNSMFNKNNTDIYIHDYRNATGNYPFLIRACVFTCRTLPPLIQSGLTTNQLKSATNPVTNPLQSRYIHNGLYPSTNVLPTYGVSVVKPIHAIRLEYVGETISASPTGNNTSVVYNEIVIGSSVASEYNVIDNHEYGIYAYAANFTCYNTVFQNSIDHTNALGGTGIYAFNREVNNYNRLRAIPSSIVVGNGTSNITGTHNRFYNCKNGISSTDYFETAVYNCLFQSTQNKNLAIAQSPGENGYWASSNRFLSHSIQLDTFYNIANSVTFLGTISPVPLAPGIFQYNKSVAIDFNIIQPHFNMLALTNQYIAHGIRANNAANFINGTPGSSTRVSNNRILSAYRGIEVNNWREQESDIVNNNIVLVQQPNNIYPSQYGISYANNIGVLFQPSPNKHIINNYVQGFGSTVIPSVPSIGIYHQNDDILETRCNHTFNIERGIEYNLGNNNCTFMDNIMEKNHWGYVLSGNGYIGIQGSSANPSDNQWIGILAGDYKTAVINSDASFSQLCVRQSISPYDPDGSSYTGGSSFYPYTFSSFPPTLLLGNPTITHYCPPPVSSIVASISPIPHWEEIATAAFPYFGNADAAQFVYENNLFTTLASADFWRDSSAVLDSFYVANENGKYGILYNISKTINNGDWTLAQQMLASFSPQLTIEQYYSQYYSLYIKAYTDSLTSADSTLLFHLASLCPENAGSIAVQAAALYNAYYQNSASFGYDCSESNGFRLAQKPIIASKYEVYPNPTSGAITLTLPQSEETQIQLHITDLSGKTVIEQILSARNGSVSSQLSLTAGIYFIHILNISTHENYIQKLIVQP